MCGNNGVRAGSAEPEIVCSNMHVLKRAFCRQNFHIGPSVASQLVRRMRLIQRHCPCVVMAYSYCWDWDCRILALSCSGDMSVNMARMLSTARV